VQHATRLEHRGEAAYVARPIGVVEDVEAAGIDDGG
jgi:hypothetical protein